jgi:hypothetical protein
MRKQSASKLVRPLPAERRTSATLTVGAHETTVRYPNGGFS